MIIRAIRHEERPQYEKIANHPLQSWEWGEFRRALGHKVERLGVFDDQGKLQSVWQVIFSDIPLINMTAGYVPRGPQPTPEVLKALRDLGKKHQALFIKLEPNLFAPATKKDPFPKVTKMLEDQNIPEGRNIFAPYTFFIDLTQDDETLFENCKSKTRYNVRLARRKGVTIVEDTSPEGLADYLKLLEKTTSRQKFYAHDQNYYQTMFDKFKDTGKLRILKALYEDQVLTAWILFFHGDTAYYPYGASSREHRDVMANNLMMWEAMMLAKKEGMQQFDLWGALGPNADKSHKWYGFHRFKEGYGAQLKQSLGSYDVVVNFPLYSLFTLANNIRWGFLRLRSKIGL